MRRTRLLSLFAVGSLAAILICMTGIPEGQADERMDGSAAAKACPSTILDPLDAANRANPYGSFTLSGTTLYGMTTMGGAVGKGTIFKFDTNKNVETVLYSFAGPPNDGVYPSEPLTLVGSTLYGMTDEGGAKDKGTIFEFDTEKNVETVLHDFTGGTNDGAAPHGALTLVGTTLYGMTFQGGANGKGTIFKFDTKENVLTVVYSFAGGTKDGAYPHGSPTLLGTTLYGMTSEGGANPGADGLGLGTIFMFDTEKSVETVLYSFAGPPNDGAAPHGSFTLVGTTLYSMTSQGGANGKGTIFKFDTEKNVETVLHSFAGGKNDGVSYCASLTLSGTTLYGMTLQGGAGHGGTLFKFDTGKNVPTVLHGFAGGANDGAYPYGSLTPAGPTLYGMTHGGGAGGAGTIFKFDTEKNVETVLHSFAGGTNDGAYPFSQPLSFAESSSIPSGAVTCKGSVYTVDPDPKGTNVRSAPDRNSPVLIVIPQDSEGTVVDLAASSGDWVLIHSAQGVTSGSWFQGQGWVHASLLGVRAVNRTGRKASLHSKPDAGSSVIKMFAGETEARLAGCKVDWMQVKIGEKKGWLSPDDYCGNPVTTCP
ncbi:MAG: choice-of-anchor tandem repeat GloVer-containing protein [Syntrophobacteraceae bacterium]|jgi:uncharacterized repeat protein (TIGR03803 family)